MRPWDKRGNAFTLVELLVVVSIIALLISILLPSLRKAREQAKSIKCLGHMRGMGQAAMVFSSDHDGRIQLVAAEGNVETADPGRQRFAYGAGDELLAWPVAFAQVIATGFRDNWNWGVRATDFEDAEQKQEYINKSMDLYICPGDKVQLASSFFPRHEGMYGFGLPTDGDPANPSPPVDKMAYWGRLSYGVNEDVAGGDGPEYDFWPSCWRAAPSKNDGGWEACEGGRKYGPSTGCFQSSSGSRLEGQLGKIFDPGKVGLFFETGPESKEQAKLYPTQFANLVNSATYSGAPAKSGPYLGNAQQVHPWRIPTNRHPDGQINVSFADGHAETVRAREYTHNTTVKRKLPSRYAPRVRVSPFNPHGVE